MVFKNNSIRAAAALLLTGVLLVRTVTAQDAHVVTPDELQKALVDAAQSREQDLAGLHDFFASEPAAKIMKNAHVDPIQIQRAVSFLDDQELAQLSARANTIKQDFVAGSLTNQQLTYIVIALATAVIVIVLVGR